MALWSNVDNEAGKPKYLNTAEKAATAGVSVEEASVAANKAKGVAHAGWVTTRTYTDSSGATRNKTEVLVAMGSMVQAGGDLDADDTTIGIDPTE
jgi:hypothetical protein